MRKENRLPPKQGKNVFKDGRNTQVPRGEQGQHPANHQSKHK